MSAVCLSAGAFRGKGLEKERSGSETARDGGGEKEGGRVSGLRKGRGRGEIEERGEGLGR